MKLSKHNRGFTIIELLTVVAILGVLATFGYPAYIGYIDSGCLSTARQNAGTLRGFQENYLIENETYLAGTHNAGDGASALAQGLHWNPDDDDRYTYQVQAGSTGNIATSLLITVSADNCSTDITNGN